MLKKREKVRKIVIVLISLIMILGGYIRVQAIDLGQGTIDPVYKPEWEVVSSTANISTKKIEIVVKGSAYESQTIDSNTKIDYSSSVTSTLAAEDISVFIDGTNITDLTVEEVSAGTTSTNATTGKTEVTHTITLSNFEEATRRAGIPYKEWSGYISLNIAGRGEDSSTYYTGTNRVLYDEYGNQNMSEIDSTGTWLDVMIGEEFADFVKPEFTYKWSDTTIGNGVTGDKKLKVVFDITDKHFSSSTITENANNITVAMLDDATAAVNTAVTKTVTKKTIDADVTDANGVTYKTNGDIYYNGVKVGERYELVVDNLEQDPNDSFNYSGPMSITFPASIATDTSNNSNNATTITIGINEDDGNAGTTPDADKGYDQGNQEIVDVVDPIWKYEDKTVTTDANGITSANVGLVATDKYFADSTLSLDNLQILVDGENKVSELDGRVTLTGPTAVTNGEKYIFSLSRLEETYEEFLAQRALYAADSLTGRLYREFSGPVQVVVPKGTAVDDYGNDSEQLTIDLGTIDTLKPEVVKVSSQVVEDATNIENSKLIVTFDITDKYLASSAITTTNTSKIHVYVDGTEATSITKTITNIETLQATINGTTKTIGYRYTLQLSNFENPRTSAVYGQYTDWSGEVTIKVEAGTATDTSGTGNAETIIGELQGTEEDYVDFIKPDVTYKYSESTQAVAGDINYGTKTFKMVFDITDKHFSNSTLTIDDLTIKIDNETPDWTKVTKELTSADVSATVNGSSTVIGKRYTLTLSNLEQTELAEGDAYLDYSGVVTVVIPQGKATDTGPAGDGNNPNGNDATTITSGVDVYGESGSGLPSTTYTTPYLPDGYSYVEGDLDTGLVIADPLGNEYVWVEVPRNTTVYDEAGLNLDLDNLTGTDLTNAYTAIEDDLHDYTVTYRNSTTNTDTWSSEALTGIASADDYNALKYKMLKSVYQNGGFYVGRYETGIADTEPDVIDTTVEARTASGSTTQTPVIQANAYPYNYVTSKQAQTLASSFASGEYTSSLMFGVQWDLVLKYLETKAVEKGTSQATIISELNSHNISWGNYGESKYTVTDVRAKYLTNTNNMWIDGAYSKTDSYDGYMALLSCGAVESFCKQNIFDLAGNVKEFTLEKNESYNYRSC